MNSAFVAQFRDGRSFEFRDLPDLATWWQIFYRNVYPVNADDRVIIDAGANIGAFTLYALTRAPRAKVIAIEPFPETFSRLRSALEQAPYADRVRLVNAALGSHSGSVSMQDGAIGSQFRRVLDDSDPQTGTRVSSCTLAEILDSVEGEIDFLKMDIEGSEYAAILASPAETLRRIRRVAMEFHPLYSPNAPQPRDLFEHFEKAGFTAIEVQDHGEGYGMAYLRRN
jgi:FkbM family methyltransferase